MLTGVVAANILKVIDASDPRALGLLLVGYIVHGKAISDYWQSAFLTLIIGLGFFMAFFYLAIYILR